MSQDQHLIPIEQLSQRSKRSFIFHLLYAAAVHPETDSFDAIADSLIRGFNVDTQLDSPIVRQAREITLHKHELDAQIIPFLTKWKIERLSIPTILILRYALWELNNTDLAPTIVLNEAIELAKCFTEQDAYKFINGVLDKIIKQKNEK